MLQTAWLRTFEAVVRLGSFADAGRSLGYTTSAVSQQMTALERSSGVQLFERRARQIKPTPAASYLYSRSTELISLLARVESELARLSAGQVGRLRIGSFSSAGTSLLPEAIAILLADHPEAEITYDEGEPFELVPRVIRADTDVALVFRYDLVPRTWPAELTVTPLATEPLLVIASRSHHLAGRRSQLLSQLADESWIASLASTTLHACLEARTAQAGFVPNVTFRTNNFPAIRGLVSANLGLALVPASALEAEDQGIAVVNIEDELPQRHVAAVSRRLDDSPLLAAFLRSLHRAASTVHGYQPAV